MVQYKVKINIYFKNKDLSEPAEQLNYTRKLSRGQGQLLQHNIGQLLVIY